MSFRITQACGVEDSSHFVKIRLFVVGCTSKLRQWLEIEYAAAYGF